jgi:hypothetical protein
MAATGNGAGTGGPGTLLTGLASEGGHWYAADGTPCYEIIARNGLARPVTLRDARKMNLYPGVTTITRMAAAPGLERWKRRQVLMSALTLPRERDEDADAFLKRVERDSEEQAKLARERGTEIHAQIEDCFKGLEPTQYSGPVIDWLNNRFPGRAWSAEKSFANPLGYGGKLDLYAPGIIIDYKTKDFGPEDDVIGYDEHLMQLVACAKGLGEDMSTATLLNLFVSTRVPGLIVPIEWTDMAERFRAWTMFQNLLGYWKALKRVA